MAFKVDLSRVAELSELAVPDWVRGVWQRTRLVHDGHEDRDPVVIWIQTPTLYADIRVPIASSGADAAARAEGFAGWLDVEDQICRWHRPIDLNPRPEGGDQGAMFRNLDVMTEIGVLANYLEDYRLLEPATRCLAASRGKFTSVGGKVRFAARGPLEILVSAGSYVTHAKRTDRSSVRHGRYDETTEKIDFHLQVGDTSIFSDGRETWTVWTDEGPDCHSLLAAAQD